MSGLLSRFGWRTPEIALAALLALLHAWLMTRLTQGNFFNSYPFISNDGFDWIMQGLALKQRLAGVDANVLLFLRNPVYVVIHAIDAAAGGRGAVVIFAAAVAVFVTLAVVARHARALGCGLAVAMLVVAAQYFSVLGFWRLYVLSDTVAVALMTMSFALAIRAAQRPDRAGLVPSAVFAVTAGLTQTYGLIPFLVFASVIGLAAWRKDRPAVRAWAIAAALVVISTSALQQSWATFVPHEERPAQFELLRPSLEMTGFYFNVWTMTFGCFVPFVAIALWRRWRGRIAFTPVEWGIGATLAAFATLAFFYQWRESRFTFIFLPIFFIAALSLAAPAGKMRSEGPLGWACAVSVLLGLTLAPANQFDPVLQGSQVNWVAAWPGEALGARPLDRFAVREHCPNWRLICAAAPMPADGDAYRQMMYLEYQRRERLEGN